MRMLWVMIYMYVSFVAPSLMLRRCACVTSVGFNIVWMTSIHVIV